MKTKVLFLLFSCGTSLATTDFINKYFPENSIVRKAHNSEPHGTNWFGFDSDLRSACDTLNDIFTQLAQRPYHDRSIWYLHVYESLERAIKTIASDQDEKIIRNELDWAWELKSYLDKKVEEKYLNTEEYLQALEREKRIAAIREALQLKDYN